MKTRLEAEQEIREKQQYHFLDKTVQRDLASKKHMKKCSKDMKRDIEDLIEKNTGKKEKAFSHKKQVLMDHREFSQTMDSKLLDRGLSIEK